MKKLVSFGLSLALAASALSMTAFAEEDKDDHCSSIRNAACRDSGAGKAASEGAGLGSGSDGV